MKFEQFDLHPTLAANVRALGYETPTPIQQQAIPPALQKRDIVGLAQTGTGKTAAFALPVQHRLITEAPRQGARRAVRALIVAPTRELAEQINDSIIEYGQGTGLRSATVYGGVNINPQIAKLKAGVDIVVACPGRLLDHVGQRTIDLSQVEILILDEADQMFDMGFLPSIRRILTHVPKNRQTLLFSATMPPDIHQLAREALRDPITVQIDHSRPTTTVSHFLYPVASHLKVDLLTALLEQTETESVLVFTAAKHRAKRVAEKLVKAGYRATSLQGNLSQNRRQEAITGFREGQYQIMVATDVAARGIDIDSISHVINFDMPNTLDAYTHRIGRTGRAARTGDALTFITDEDTAMVRSIERALSETIERRHLPGFDYNQPAPRKDTTFARPPREPRPQPKAKSAASGQAKSMSGNGQPRHASAASQPKSSASQGQPMSAAGQGRPQSVSGQPASFGSLASSAAASSGQRPRRRRPRRSGAGAASAGAAAS